MNYNKILEAVNRGIKFALDDFEDNNELQGQFNSKVKYTGGINEWLDLMEDVVDLGLPSGTLWCKYNLGCDFELLNNHYKDSIYKNWYGDYYAWGEIIPNKYREGYGWNTYKWCKNTYDKLTKYCNDKHIGYNNYIDNLTELEPEDDAAYQNLHLYNFKFYMPTINQFKELVNYTNHKYVKNYKHISNLNGLLFTSKNKNTLFLPMSGFYYDTDCVQDKIVGDYLSLNLCTGDFRSIFNNGINDSASAYCFEFIKQDYQKLQISYDGICRAYGMSIRPVINR